MTEIYSIILEVRRLFRAGAALADVVHQDLNITASQRAVLETLASTPGQTVPGIARGKGVTRQHIQGLVNQLLKVRFIEQQDNPAHKKSPILNLTRSGRRCFEEIMMREERLLREMEAKFREYDLPSVANCLREMTDCFQTVTSVQQSDAESLSTRKT